MKRKDLQINSTVKVEIAGKTNSDIFSANQNNNNRYIESGYDMPYCNHSGASEENIGFSVGVMSDGTPFEAECWECGGTLALNVVIPQKAGFYSKKRCLENTDKKGNAPIPFYTQQEIYCFGLLCAGMVDGGEENDIQIIQEYVDYLVEMGLVNFSSEAYNGIIFYRTVELGNDLVEIIITLLEDDEVYANTNLKLRPFPGLPRLKLSSRKE